MEHHDERGIEANEIMGDLLADLEREIAADDIDAHYLDWCERHDVTPTLVPDGTGTDPEGDTVQVWRFA